MSGTARTVMRHRCQIDRDQGGFDAHGGEVAHNWQPHTTGQACYAFYTTGMLQQQPQQTEAIEQLRLLLPIGTDVRRDDRIAQVTDRQGNVLFTGPLAIQGPVARRADHLALALKQVT